MSKRLLVGNFALTLTLVKQPYRVLLTGFVPFANASSNPSAQVVENLPDIQGVQLRRLVLPVEYDVAAAELLAESHEFQPDAIVSLGQAEGRAKITVERVAVNLRGATIADNAGRKIVDQAIVEDAPAAYFSTLPVAEILDRTEIVQSLSAGTFICNEVMFRALHESAVEQTNSQPRAGFIHLPLMAEQASEFPGLPTMQVSQMIEQIVQVIETLRDTAS